MKLLVLALVALSALAAPIGWSLLSGEGEAAASVSFEPVDAPSTADTFAGHQTLGFAVVAPRVGCAPLCSFGHGVLASGGLDFPVFENATRIVVTATWTPSTPVSSDLALVLTREDAACGGCSFGVGRGEGAGRVVFEADEVRPGRHSVEAWPKGPAGAAIRQDVRVEVEVHYS